MENPSDFNLGSRVDLGSTPRIKYLNDVHFKDLQSTANSEHSFQTEMQKRVCPGWIGGYVQEGEYQLPPPDMEEGKERGG